MVSKTESKNKMLNHTFKYFQIKLNRGRGIIPVNLLQLMPIISSPTYKKSHLLSSFSGQNIHQYLDKQAGKHGGVGCTGNSKQSAVACRDNHCKVPLSHSARIKPTGLNCRPTEDSHTNTHTHKELHRHTDVLQHLHNTQTTFILLILPHTCFLFSL